MASLDPVMRHNEALDPEKRQVSLKENIDGSQDGSGYEFSPREQKKIIHRIDRRLVVTVGVLYCISLMDRTNLSAAAIAGFVGVIAGMRVCDANRIQHDG
jgi:small-conductance mechanosensitive channel